MGDYMNKESMKLSRADYYRAVSKLLKICPMVESDPRNHSASRIFQPVSRCPDRSMANIIFSASHEEIMELGRPKIIGPGYHIWDSSFFRVHWGINFPFTRYSWNFPRASYTDSDGTFHEGVPAQLVSTLDTIELRGHGMSGQWGLKDWWMLHREIETMFDDSKLFKQHLANYRREIQTVDKMVREWEEAMSKLSSRSRIPVPSP